MAINLCDTEDITKIIDTIGRFSSTEIDTEIAYQTESIYDQYGEPLGAIISNVDTDENNAYYKKLYVGERNIYRVDDVFIGTTTKRKLTSTTDYTTSTTHGMIQFTGTTLAGADMTDSDEVIIWFVPKMYHKYCVSRTSEKLLEKTDQTSGEKASKELTVIKERMKDYEDFIKNKIQMQLASQYEYYEDGYDTNSVKFKQNYVKNNYIWS